MDAALEDRPGGPNVVPLQGPETALEDEGEVAEGETSPLVAYQSTPQSE